MDASLSQTFARWRSSGQPRLLAEVFDRASPELLRVAIHLVGEAGAAEDLVQATFLTAIERAKTFDESRRLEPWLAGILENHAHELARLAARSPDPQLLEKRLAETPLDQALTRELSAEIAAAIDRLPEPYRRTLLLRVRHGLAPADIAHVLGESPGTVRVRLHRALELLRKELPSGLALGALFALEPARGMSAVKGAVLAAGAGGVLVMKKVLLAAAVLALLLLGWWKWPAVTPELAAKIEPKPADVALESGPQKLSTPAVAEAARTVADGPAAATVFHFRGKVVDGESDEPIEGATIELYPARSMKLSEIKRRYDDVLSRDWYGGGPGPAPWPWVDSPATLAQRADREPFVVSAPPEAGEPALASGVSAHDGSFDLVESRSQGFLVCRREGFATRMLPMRRSIQDFFNRDGHRVEETRPLESLLVRMFREYEIHGALIDEEGERVRESVKLRFCGFTDFEKREQPPIDDPCEVNTWAVETAGDGSFALRVAAPHIQLEPLDPEWSVCREGLHPERKQRSGFDLSFDRQTAPEILYVVVRRTPVLRVRDRETHAPIEDIVLIARGRVNGYASLCGPYHAPRGELRLARFNVVGSPLLSQDEEAQELTVWAEGYAPASVSGSLSPKGGDILVELARGELPVCKGSLRRGIEPLANVTIAVTPESNRGWYTEDTARVLESTKTDASGGFSFRAPAGFFVLRFTLDGTTRTRSVELPLAQPLLIDLGSEARVQVHVRDSNGVPRVGHVVSLEGRLTGSHLRHTDAQGDVTFEGLMAGTCRVSVPFVSSELSFMADFQKELELLDGQSVDVEAVIPADDPRYAHLAVAGERDLTAWRGRDRSKAVEWLRLEPDGRLPLDIQKGVRILEFERGAGQRWQFLLPQPVPADLVLRVDPGGPAYEVELVWGSARTPIGGAGIIWASAPAVSALTNAQGSATLGGLSLVAPRLVLRPRALEGWSGDLLSWDRSWGACSFEPLHPPGSPPVHLAIELPNIAEGRFADLPELHLSGTLRMHGAARSDVGFTVVSLIAQPDGTLALHATGATSRTLEGGRYDVRVPLTAKARFLVYDPEGKKFLDPIEWEPTPGLLEQQRDFDL